MAQKDAEAWVLDTLKSGLPCSLWTLRSAVLADDKKYVEDIVNRLVSEGRAVRLSKHKWQIMEGKQIGKH